MVGKRRFRAPFVLAALLAAGATTVLTAGSAPAISDDYIGHAYGVQAGAGVLGSTAAKTTKLPYVQLPATGGTVEAGMPGISSPIPARILQVSSSGSAASGTRTTTGQAKAAEVNLVYALPGVMIGVRGAVSYCTAIPSGTIGFGGVDYINLGPFPILAGYVPPNTVIPVPGVGTLTINEQIVNYTPATTAAGGKRTITVSAVHFKAAPGASLLGPTDVVIAQTHCGLSGPSVP